MFSFTYDGSKNLAVTEQAMPSNFDAGSFNPTSKFTTTIGTAYEVDLDTRTTAAIVTDRTLLLINAPDKISVDTLNQFINALKQVSG